MTRGAQTVEGEVGVTEGRGSRGGGESAFHVVDWLSKKMKLAETGGGFIAQSVANVEFGQGVDTDDVSAA